MRILNDSTHQLTREPESMAAEGSSVSARAANLEKDIQRCEGLTGISQAHLKVMHEKAVDNDSILMFRPVHPLIESLVGGGYPTKPLSVKGKTANWGPQYGFVCENPSLSKLAGDSPDSIEKARVDITTCCNMGHAVSIPLQLSDERLKELVAKGIMTMALGDAKGEIKLSCFSPGSTGPIHFVACKVNPSDRFHSISLHGSNVMVLAPVHTNEPVSGIKKGFTADYDMYAVLPRISALSSEHTRRASVVSARSSASSIMALPPGRRRSSYALLTQDSQRRSLEELREQKPVTLALSESRRGSMAQSIVSDSSLVDLVSADEAAIASAINETLRSDLKTVFPIGWQLIHHGSDRGNPHPDDRTNHPVTVITPGDIGGFPQVSVMDELELSRFIGLAIQKGWHMEINRNNPDERKRLKGTSAVQQRVAQLELNDRFEGFSFGKPEVRRPSSSSTMFGSFNFGGVNVTRVQESTDPGDSSSLNKKRR